MKSNGYEEKYKQIGFYEQENTTGPRPLVEVPTQQKIKII
tara:strand:+ start:501 stop:620 length:120 start_codon:yes stop_codon:yes gene_type:complete